MLIIYKALYGLHTSGLCWHKCFADCLRKMVFEPCKAEPDIWMHRNGNIYKYIAVYVDDLAIATKDPEAITCTLIEEYDFKLKGMGLISFHLGCDFFQDDKGVLCFAPRKYIERMIDKYQHMFGCKPPQKGISLPLKKLWRATGTHAYNLQGTLWTLHFWIVAGTNALLIVFAKWASNPARPNLTYGCTGMVMYTSTLPYM